MAAGTAVLKTILQENLLEHCRKTGAYFLSQLKKLQQKHAVINEVRGKGLMLAVKLNIDAAGIVGECLKQGLLVNSTGGQVLRFVPPLIITEQDIDQTVAVLDSVLEGK